MIQFVIRVVASLTVGLLAGLNLGSMIAHYGFPTLSATAWIRTHQAEDGIFSRVMPPFLLGTLALAALATAVSSGAAKWQYLGSGVLVAVDLAMTIAGLVPLNRVIAIWDADAPPQIWAQTRDQWDLLHAIRNASVVVTAEISIGALAATRAA
jgi:hypothetical protein